jgi:hypothetical protein
MDVFIMNRNDHSVPIKIIKGDKEKVFDLPYIVDNQVWFQIFKDAKEHRVEWVSLDIKISR